jgi:HD-GYP domain-containing protein (c-di-GMP phosphodiesterase class II)
MMDTISFEQEQYDLKFLVDPKHPFMEKLRDKAPGTYKHCQNVAGLCEAVALELDIDANVMRVLECITMLERYHFLNAFMRIKMVLVIFMRN